MSEPRLFYSAKAEHWETARPDWWWFLFDMPPQLVGRNVAIYRKPDGTEVRITGIDCAEKYLWDDKVDLGPATGAVFVRNEPALPQARLEPSHD